MLHVVRAESHRQPIPDIFGHCFPNMATAPRPSATRENAVPAAIVRTFRDPLDGHCAKDRADAEFARHYNANQSECKSLASDGYWSTPTGMLR